jgi:hypothetical protein
MLKVEAVEKHMYLREDAESLRSSEGNAECKTEKKNSLHFPAHLSPSP